MDTRKFDPDVTKAPFDHTSPVILSARRLVRKNGPERQDLLYLAEKLGIEKKVEFLGAVPHKHMAEYIALADIAVVPSIVEASSIFMLEAMAMRKPVVATSAWGLSEIIDGKNGILTDAVHLGETIAGLLKDEQLLLELGKNARRYVIENHSWEKIAKRTEQEYLSLL